MLPSCLHTKNMGLMSSCSRKHSILSCRLVNTGKFHQYSGFKAKVNSMKFKIFDSSHQDVFRHGEQADGLAGVLLVRGLVPLAPALLLQELFAVLE